MSKMLNRFLLAAASALAIPAYARWTAKPACMTLRPSSQKFSLHYEADLDRGGISVLDIRYKNSDTRKAAD